MAAPLDPAKVDHAIQLYVSGEPVQKIQAASGVSLTRLHRERAARGIPARERLLTLPAEKIVAAYLAGASEYALSQEYGISRGPIARCLTEAGIERRSMSAAGEVRATQMSPVERKRQAAEANRASRRRRVPQIDKLRRALTLEHRGNRTSAGEQAMAEMLAARGMRVTAQRAVGVYNVDLAAAPVAVEVLGGGWHSIKSSHAERTPYILDEGWHLVMVWDYEGRSALGPGAADYVVAFAEQVRRNPPTTCQYRVITGQGESLAACGREDNEFPLVPPPRGSL